MFFILFGELIWRAHSTKTAVDLFKEHLALRLMIASDGLLTNSWSTSNGLLMDCCQTLDFKLSDIVIWRAYLENSFGELVWITFT